jgi:hypothetical protein
LDEGVDNPAPDAAALDSNRAVTFMLHEVPEHLVPEFRKGFLTVHRLAESEKAGCVVQAAQERSECPAKCKFVISAELRTINING